MGEEDFIEERVFILKGGGFSEVREGRVIEIKG